MNLWFRSTFQPNYAIVNIVLPSACEKNERVRKCCLNPFIDNVFFFDMLRGFQAYALTRLRVLEILMLNLHGIHNLFKIGCRAFNEYAVSHG